MCVRYYIGPRAAVGDTGLRILERLAKAMQRYQHLDPEDRVEVL